MNGIQLAPERKQMVIVVIPIRLILHVQENSLCERIPFLFGEHGIAALITVLAIVAHLAGNLDKLVSLCHYTPSLVLISLGFGKG
jgi:hypothetical protein